MSLKKKYYELFGLDEKASKEDIRKAYRKLAMKYHPDRNPDPRAHQIFVDLAEAYDILISDRPLKESAPKARKEKSQEDRKKRFQKESKKSRQKRQPQKSQKEQKEKAPRLVSTTLKLN